MKLAIIFPPLPFGWTPVAPPILEYLAALTRREDPAIEIEVYSASATPDVFDTLECDLAAISLLTPTSVGGMRSQPSFVPVVQRLFLAGSMRHFSLKKLFSTEIQLWWVRRKAVGRRFYVISNPVG